jgi:hypothetical protein
MKKTLKSIKKWYDGQELEPSDWRRIDAVWMEVKLVTLTILVVILIISIFSFFGAFDGIPMYKLKK